MSRNVTSAGLMAPLSRKLTEEELDKWNELLYDQGSSIRINYEGTLAYTAEDSSEYGITFGLTDTHSKTPFYDLLQFDIEAHMDRVRPYKCHWYNGGDSDMDMLELDEFLKMTGQT
jgi:hypothetical protein